MCSSNTISEVALGRVNHEQIQQGNLPSFIKLLSMQMTNGSGYLTLGSILKSVSDVDLMQILRFADQLGEQNDEYASTVMVLLTILMLQADGGEDPTDLEAIHVALNQIVNLFAWEYLARCGRMKMHYQNITLSPDGDNRLIAEVIDPKGLNDDLED